MAPPSIARWPWFNTTWVKGLQAHINNAGVAHPGRLASQPFEQLRNMFEVNFFGLVDLTRACLPLLGMQSPGRRSGR